MYRIRSKIVRASTYWVVQSRKVLFWKNVGIFYSLVDAKQHIKELERLS